MNISNLTGNKRLLMASACTGAALTVGTVCCGYAITNTLMSIALDKKAPKILDKLRDRISQSERTREFISEMERTENILLSRKNLSISIEAADGTRLTGHWIPSDKQKRIIIAMHGWRARWSRDFGMIADFWKDEGCSVLYAEQRGQNASECEHMGFGLTERFDCLEWAKWASRYFPDVPVYLAGISMGATTVLMSADLELPQEVRGIIADCAFTSPDAIWQHVVHDNLHLPCNIRSLTADRICRRRTGYGSKECSTTAALRRSKLPVLLIHGTDDNFVPVEMAYENYKACGADKRIFVVPGADHGMSYYLDKPEYEETMRRFWNDFD